MGSLKPSVIALGLCATFLLHAEQSPAAEAFSKLSKLSGSWKGTVQWSGARQDSGDMNASYYVTGGGSAIVENLMSGETPGMSTVYHLDGADLRMTHYCAAHNQPRLKASHIDNAKGAFDFEFVDVTDLPKPDAPHVTAFAMRLLAADHITLTFTFTGAGKESREFIDLKRAQ